MAVMALIKANKGFTLTELAVVLVIVGLLMGGLLIPLGAQKEIEKRGQTSQQLSNIRDTLLAYATINGTLPCPATDENGIAPATCAAPSATDRLPWRTLALPQHDPWGNSWRYRIERKYATPQLTTLILKTDSTAFPDDKMNVVNNAGQSLICPSCAVPEYPIAIVYSLGANLKADGQNDETVPLDALYQSDTPSPSFDDILIWLNRTALISPLIASGKIGAS